MIQQTNLQPGYYWVKWIKGNCTHLPPFIAIYRKRETLAGDCYCWEIEHVLYQSDMLLVLSGRIVCPLEAFI